MPGGYRYPPAHNYPFPLAATSFPRRQRQGKAARLAHIPARPPGRYEFHGDPNEVFASFFKSFGGLGGLGGFGGFGGVGGLGGLDDLFDLAGGGPSFVYVGGPGGFGGVGMGRGARAAPLVSEVGCTLEELLRGATKSAAAPPIPCAPRPRAAVDCASARARSAFRPSAEGLDGCAPGIYTHGRGRDQQRRRPRRSDPLAAPAGGYGSDRLPPSLRPRRCR